MDYTNISNLLESWGVPQDVIKNFVDNGITIENLKELNPLYLKELCPHIGSRIKLTSQIQDLVDSVAETETLATSGPSTASPAVQQEIIRVETSSPIQQRPAFNNYMTEEAENSLPDLDISTFFNEQYQRPPLPEFDVRTLLQTSAHGCSILNYYNQFKHLNSKKRTILVDILVKHIYTYIINNHLKPEDYNLIAAKIVALFPSENIGSYYMQAIPTSKSSTGKYIPAKGKLVDKVRNLLYISEAKRRTRSSKNNKNEPENNETIIESEVTANYDILWLKNNSEPWEEVIERWQTTFPFRQNQNQSTVHEYLEKWEILKNHKGHVLINLDFEKQYKEKSLNFYKKWNIFFEKLLLFKKCQVTNENALNLIETLNEIAENDKKIPIQMYLMAYLVPPKGRLSRKIKFSAAEATEGLIVQVHNAGDIEEIIKKQKEKAASRHRTVQPYILLQGSLQEFSGLYIVIDDIKYQLQSATKAFDLLFKIYHVFHVKYPESAEYLYLIIQRKVYEITTQYDRVPPHIVEILNL